MTAYEQSGIEVLSREVEHSELSRKVSGDNTHTPLATSKPQ